MIADIAPTGADERVLLEWLRTMREEHPVWRDRYGVWHVFRHSGVEAVIRDPATFSSNTARLTPAAEPVQRGMLAQSDPPYHRALRQLVGAAFTPRTIARLEPRIRAVTDELLDAVGERFDLVEDFAFPLPVIVIAELLGLPAQDRALFGKWADALFALQVDDPRDPELKPRIAATMAEITGYFAEHCRDRRARPRQDLLSALITAEVEGRRLDDVETVNFAMLLLLAGHITATALLGNSVRTFDEHPAVWAELHSNPGLIPSAIEEVLRYRSPFTQIGRSTLSPTTVDGMPIPADVLVTPWLLSANRDPRVHTEPERFDIHRSPGTGALLAFGQGIHFCPGQALVRLEGKVALEAFLTRYRTIEVDHDTLTRTGGLRHFPRRILGTRNLPVHAIPA